ncbi:alpha/beta fold hydrolase [Streptomyces winkii]|uniref:alpha/beta fold hydrolase n=1 Tax=Streptomyces winkii TaxID=3051178 RepID=UPI0028D773B0|nr:alpha/beta fold hydrolase [Streptomyces sp. DSM 40971]
MNPTEDRDWFPGRSRVADPGMRLFCLPHAGAGASAYRGWQQSLGADVEVVPVHLPGRESRITEPPEADIRRLAERLAQPLARRAAGLPYAVFGHSMGALLGYELTRLLAGAGRPPALLIASGASAPHLPIAADPPVHLMPEQELLAHLGELAGTPRSVLSDQDLLEMVVPALRADFAACETYVHEHRPPLSVPLLVLGGDADPGVPVDSLDPWSEHTGASTTVRVWPGGHFFHHENREDVMELIAKETHKARQAQQAQEQGQKAPQEQEGPRAGQQPGPASPEETVRRYYTLVDAQDFTALVELFAPTAVYRRPGYEPLVGRKALAEFYGGERVILQGRHAITELVAADGKVAVNGRFSGTVKGGKEVDLKFADFFTLDAEGRFAARDTFFFAPMV